MDISNKLIKRKSARYTISFAIIMVAAFVLDNFLFGPRIKGMLGNYVYPTIMWLLVILFMRLLPGASPGLSTRLRKLINSLAVVCVFIGILGAMIQGMMDGFGKSPFDHSLLGMTVNVISVGTFVAAIELTRSWLMQRHFKHRPAMGVTLIGLLYSAFSIPMAKLMNLEGLKNILEFAGSTALPEISASVLTSYLALAGGFWPAFIYHGGSSLFEYLSPVLPNVGVVSSTLIGTVTPILTLILVQQIFTEEKGYNKARREENHLGWAVGSVTAIVLIWFCMGVFSFVPRVIVSGSMVPTIDIGDIIVVKKMPGEMVEYGDIIMFQLGSMKVAHRIVSVKEEEGRRVFTTQGDAYDSPDADPVTEKAVIGKVVVVIPKAGWITMALRGWIS